MSDPKPCDHPKFSIPKDCPNCAPTPPEALTEALECVESHNGLCDCEVNHPHVLAAEVRRAHAEVERLGRVAWENADAAKLACDKWEGWKVRAETAEALLESRREHHDACHGRAIAAEAERDEYHKTTETWRRIAALDTAALEDEREDLMSALKHYARRYEDGKVWNWTSYVCDKYSGLLDHFDWRGEEQDEPWEVAERALNRSTPAALPASEPEDKPEPDYNRIFDLPPASEKKGGGKKCPHCLDAGVIKGHPCGCQE